MGVQLDYVVFEFYLTVLIKEMSSCLNAEIETQKRSPITYSL